MKQKKIKISVYLFCILLLITVIASAVTPTPKPQKRIYFSLNLPYNSIRGDFNGNMYLNVPTTGEYLMVPKIKDNFGFGATAGYSQIGINNLGYALEISFYRSRHDYEWLIYRGKATYNMLNFDARGIYSFMPIEPYLVLGLTVPWVNVEDGAGLDNNAQYINPTDARFSGVGLNIGCGIDLFLTPNISFGGSVLYRWVSFTIVNGNSGDIKIDKGIQGGGLHFGGAVSINIPFR